MDLYGLKFLFRIKNYKIKVRVSEESLRCLFSLFFIFSSPVFKPVRIPLSYDIHTIPYGNGSTHQLHRK